MVIPTSFEKDSTAKWFIIIILYFYYWKGFLAVAQNSQWETEVGIFLMFPNKL